MPKDTPDTVHLHMDVLANHKATFPIRFLIDCLPCFFMGNNISYKRSSGTLCSKASDNRLSPVATRYLDNINGECPPVPYVDTGFLLPLPVHRIVHHNHQPNPNTLSSPSNSHRKNRSHNATGIHPASHAIHK